MPKISVIIPCYNAKEYIVRCLEALERQVYKDFDVILIDDCSSDNTIHVIDEYRSSSSMNIHLLRNSLNRGPAASRKRGVINSVSEFICFCDSDDWYDSNYLQEMMTSQSENKSDVVFCSFRFVLGSGKTIERLNVYQREDLQSNRRVLVKGPDSLCLMLVRRSIIESLPNPNVRNGEDMALIPLIISKANGFSAVNKCMYNYFCRDDSASMRPSMKMIENLEQSFSFVEQHLSSSFQTEKEFIGIRNLLYGALINLFKFSFDKKKADQIVDGFEVLFPKWYNNPNIKELPVSKQVFLKFIHGRIWIVAKAMSCIHSFLLR